MQWQRKVGSGYAGPAVVGERLVICHRVGDELVVEALDASTGNQLWETKYATNYRDNYGMSNGPRCVPVIYKGGVYVFGSGGNLHGLALADGRKKWSRRTQSDFTVPSGYFGVGSTPIVESDKLLVNVGGRNGAGLVAFNLETGATIWKSTDETASYSSPSATTIGGTRHVVFVTRYNTVSIDPDNGHVRFRFPFGRRGPTVNAATPLLFDGHLFVSSSYSVGARLAVIGDKSASMVWNSDDVMSSQYTTCVFRDGYLYGIHGRQDVGQGELRCLEAKTGKVVWREEDFGIATLILADNKLLIMTTEGELVLAKATPQSFTELARTTVFRRTTRALPALAGGRFFVRDDGPEKGTLKCLRLPSRS